MDIGRLVLVGVDTIGVHRLLKLSFGKLGSKTPSSAVALQPERTDYLARPRANSVATAVPMRLAARSHGSADNESGSQYK